MKISIITATFNSERSLPLALESVRHQTHRDIEHIIVDGLSTDATLGIVENHCPQIARVISEPDSGIYDALNKGVAAATGDIIGLVHSDDTLASPTVLDSIRSCFESQHVDGVYGDLQYVSASSPQRVIRHWRSCSFEPRLLKRGWMPAHPTLYLRPSVYAQYGGFDTSLKIAADYDFMLRILKSGTLKVAYLPEVIVKMRTGGISNRSIRNIFRKSREDLVALRRNEVGGLGTLFLKNVGKVPQFFERVG